VYLVILDGLDEVAEISQRQIVAEQIEDLVAKLSTNQFLVTSRPIGYQSVQLSGDFRHVTLQHMNEKEQEQFVNLWHKEMRARGAGQAEVTQFKAEPDDLLKTMKSKPSISKLASNPLLLTIIVLMYWRGTKLPDRRVDIYASATETLIENWPLRQRGIDLDFEQMKSILAPVALAILSSTVSGVIPERNLMPVLLKVVEDVHGGTRAEIQLICNNVLRDLSEHSGIFLERGRDEFDYPVFGFLHQTFGEYLAAVALAEQWNVGQIELATYVHRARWREVILLMAGVLGTQGRAVASRFISQLFELNSPFESILHRDLLLTLDCLADDLRIQPNLRNEILSHGVALLSHEVFELRQIAQSRIRQLKGTDHEGAVAIHLKKLLTEITAQPKSSLREEIRLAIADVLCHLGESEYVRSIIWEISENPHVFRNITNSVQGIVTKLRVLYWPNQSTNWLADLFTSERPIRPRLVIGESPAEIFIRTADGTDIQFIDRFEHSDINNLFNELKKRVADEEVISRLEWAYLQIDPSNTISKLKILIQPDNDRQVRFLAAKKLIEFGYDKEAISTLYDLSSGVDTNAFTAVNKLIELGQPVAEVHSVYELAALQQTRGTIQLAF